MYTTLFSAILGDKGTESRRAQAAGAASQAEGTAEKKLASPDEASKVSEPADAGPAVRE